MPDRNDDPVGIPNGTRLFRRVDPTMIVFDKVRKERRPTSQNFQNSKDGTPMSVFAENVAVAHDMPNSSLLGSIGFVFSVLFGLPFELWFLRA